MTSIKEKLGKQILFFDGAMGSMLQKSGMAAGEYPELLNIKNPELITDIHKQYIKAGSDIITTNTFGAYSHKFGDSLEEIVSRAVINAKTAIMQEGRSDVFTALDLGPTGKLLKPLGDLEFEDCYNLFKETAVLGEKYGADFAIIETISDTYEAKAAVLAVKENTNLPVVLTMTYDIHGKTLTGGNILTMVALLEGLGVDALGINCGLGPYQTESLFEELVKYTSLPILLQPNAGLPKVNEKGETIFDLGPEPFSASMKKMCKKGAWILGGCCGTTPEHIAALVKECKDIVPPAPTKKTHTLVSSYANCCVVDDKPSVVGEKINPTGKKLFKQALLNNDIGYIVNQAVIQKEAGASILDVNVGLPEIDEKAYMVKAVQAIQEACDLPLQIDSSDPEVIEAALRIYNGKALVNSVNGKAESMEKIFPLVKKYGGVVIGLTMDERGIPKTCEERFEIAEKIIKTAETYGIHKKDIVIDPLTLTVSAQQKEAGETLKAFKMIKEKLGVKLLAGVSNVSFGIPNRESVNLTYLALSLNAGVDLAIINPLSQPMMGVFHAYQTLSGHDVNCQNYISIYADTKNSGISEAKPAENDLKDIIIKGFKDKAYEKTEELLEKTEPLDIINNYLVPGLDYVGSLFEIGKMFLPQLILSAESAKRSFDAINHYLKNSGKEEASKGTIILATVEGDSHDIGKNIVSALLSNYGYHIIDLGKDVKIDTVAAAVTENNAKLVGLSALMTTTVVNMEKTIKKIKEINPHCVIMVGGAVLNQDYADMIKADYYGKDALASVAIAKKVLG